MSKRTKIILAVVVLAIIVAVAGVSFMRSQGSGPEVKTATVSQTDLGVTVSASGKVAAGLRADVYPAAAGTIDEVFVKDGQKVSAGDKLATLDEGPLQLALDQAESGYATAKSGLANVGTTAVSSADIKAAKANVKAAKAAWCSAKVAADVVGDSAPTETQLSAAGAAVNAALIAYNNASTAYVTADAVYGSSSPTTTAAFGAQASAYTAYLNAKAAAEKLAATNLRPAEKQAKAAEKQAYAAYLAAVASLKKAEAASPSSQRDAAGAAVVAAKTAVNLARSALDDSAMVAPIDGVVFMNSSGLPGADGKTPVASEGSPVSMAAAPFSVVDLNGSTFVAEVDEADVDRLKVGMTATVTLDSFPGKTLKTTVLRISPASQATATGGTIFPVELGLQDTGQNILIGMKGDATIEVSSIKGAMTIPVEALFNENGQNFVYRVVNNKLTKTDITVGATTDTEVEVLSGIKGGDVVALSGPTQYSDGLTVRAKSQ